MNIVVEFVNVSSKTSVDLLIPSDISAQELIEGLNEAYHLALDMNDPAQTYLYSERPVALVRGAVTLEELGIRNGSILYYDR